MKTNAPVISIIIPSYNTEKYIRKCMDSIINQTFLDFEVICVDSSTDKTKEILEEYKKKYPKKVELFFQKKCGVGAARNFGIKKARGEYLAFIDGDDYIGEKYLEELIGVAKKTDTDVIIEGFCQINNSGSKKKIFRAGNKEFSKYKHTTVWACLYKRNFITNNNIIFPNKIVEDTRFNLRVYGKKPSICFIDKFDYYYRTNPSSITNTTIKSFDNYNFLDIAKEALVQDIPNEPLKKYFMIWSLSSCLLTIARNAPPALYTEYVYFCFAWLKEHGVFHTKYLFRYVPGENFFAHIIILVFLLIVKLRLVCPFAFIICKKGS